MTFLPLPVSFLYPKNSSLATLVRYQKNKLREAGIMPGGGGSAKELDCSRLEVLHFVCSTKRSSC